MVASGIAPLSEIRPATYIGKGKVDELAGVIKSEEIGVVVMDCALSPVQQRNLEKAWGAKVLDRTGLILEIFGRRARTREGSLQVEHAHLTYQKGRLVRTWTHLERQRGGFGFLGGPGETQIESDRRMISERIAKIERELEGVKRTRKLHRDSRKRVPYPVVALVGYTNAGKSTLFNRLTRSGVMAADMLFATLDPTLRAITLPHGAKAILSDTVGFISDLPTMLVAAFRATLEEVIEADIILHVRDATHEDTAAQAHDVEEVLRALDIDPNDHERIIEVWNKIDRLDAHARAQLENIAARRGENRPGAGVGADRGGARCAARGNRGAAGADARRPRSGARSGGRGRGELAAPERRGDGEGHGRTRQARHDRACRAGQGRARAREVRSVTAATGSSGAF